MKGFYEWFSGNWRHNGGLVTSITASKMLELSISRIYRLRKEGKIREFRFQNDKTIYLPKREVDRLFEFYSMKRRLRERMKNNLLAAAKH